MKTMKYLAALLMCAGIANAQVITPTAVTFTGTATSDEGNALNVPEAIIDGSGLSAALTVSNLTTVTHAGVSLTAGSENAWATLSGGDGGDFYSNNTDTVVFEFDLGATFANIDTFASWGYHFGGYQGNSIFDVTLDFSTDGGTSTASSQTITVPFESSHDLATLVTLAPVTANYITMTVNDNQFGNAAGGDRVGIAEIRFGSNLVIPDPVAAITSFTADPASVTNGGTTTLAWTTTDADTASLDQGIGSVPTSGSTQLVITAETTYTLAVSNAFNSTNESVTVTLKLPPTPVSGTIIQPASVVSEEFVYSTQSAALTINNAGMVTAVTNGATVNSALSAEHTYGGHFVDSYVSTAPGGWPSDFFASEPAVDIVYDLTGGGDTAMDGVLFWQYENNGGGTTLVGNHLRTVEIRVNTEAEGDTTFSGAATMVTLLPVTDGDAIATNDLAGVNSAQYFALPNADARYVQVTLTDNYYDVQGISTDSGDRVGLGEIRFAQGTTFVSDPIGNIVISGPVAITGGQGMILSWGTSAGQSYDVQAKSNLITQANWITLDNVTGTGGGITVTTAVDNAENFYQVVTPTP